MDRHLARPCHHDPAPGPAPGRRRCHARAEPAAGTEARMRIASPTPPVARTSRAGTILLEVRDLVMHFQVGSGWVRAVDGVSFELRRGETMGIVGESGSGKTSLGYALLRLLPANGRILRGSIVFDGKDLVHLPEEELRRLRWTAVPMN